MSAPIDEKKPVSVEETLEETQHTHAHEVETPQSRGEKKARKAILGQGLKLVPGITRVTFTRARGIVFAIGKPEVYKSTNSETYIVFGEVQVEDMRARAQAAAAEQLAAEAAAKANETEAAAPSTEDDDEEVDATGVDEKDIDLVIGQAGVSRNKAIKALKNNNNDIVNAIMVSSRMTMLV
ncbi:NAC domain-containing protein [Dichotomocladium elegans]|nr:NAC domain-containing protein [Dichotomocladium elegans]